MLLLERPTSHPACPAAPGFPLQISYSRVSQGWSGSKGRRNTWCSGAVQSGFDWTCCPADHSTDQTPALKFGLITQLVAQQWLSLSCASEHPKGSEESLAGGKPVEPADCRPLPDPSPIGIGGCREIARMCCTPAISSQSNSPWAAITISAS